MTNLRIAGGRVVAHAGVVDGADVLVENGHVVALGETVQGALDARGCAGRVVEAGAPADLPVWDPEPAWTLTPAMLAEGLDASVWDGTEVRGRPRAVLRNGEVVAWTSA